MDIHRQHSQILANLGIEKLNPMQVSAQKAVTAKNIDTLLLAPTGSGKTLGFLLPVLQLFKADQIKVQCLILAPSRELAMQIEQVWKKMSTGFKVNVCYGGHPMATEIQNLSVPPALLIGTPGRIADHITRKTFELDGITTLVLDEFDKSLDLGFHEQMSFIIGNLPNLNKRVLVSATAGIEIPEFTGLTTPQVLDFLPEKNTENEQLTMKLVISDEKDKLDTKDRLKNQKNSQF